MKIKNDQDIDYGFVAITGHKNMEFFLLKVISCFY